MYKHFWPFIVYTKAFIIALVSVVAIAAGDDQVYVALVILLPIILPMIVADVGWARPRR